MLNNIIRFVRLKLSVTGKELKVTCQGHENEQIDERLMLEQFGFASVPPIESEGVAFFPNGYTENAVVAFLDSPEHKPNIVEGQSCIYDKFGNSVILKNGLIEINAIQDLKIIVNGNCILQANAVNITAPLTTINGNLSVNGSIGASGNCDFGGGGGQRIARVGDTVTVGNLSGVITSGSSVSRSN